MEVQKEKTMSNETRARLRELQEIYIANKGSTKWIKFKAPAVSREISDLCKKLDEERLHVYNKAQHKVKDSLFKKFVRFMKLGKK